MADKATAQVSRIAERIKAQAEGREVQEPAPTTAPVPKQESKPEAQAKPQAPVEEASITVTVDDGQKKKSLISSLNPRKKKAADAHADSHGSHDGGGHGGGHSESGLMAGILSGLICGLLMFVFACVFAEMIFGNDLPSAVPLGIGQQTLTIMVGALFFAKGSSCSAVIAGPDINPVVFLAEAATAIVEQTCLTPDQSGSTDGSGSASGSQMAGDRRMLGGSGSGIECTNSDTLVPTVLMASCFATLMVGVSFLCLGHFKLTEVVGYIPANVIAGFLSCIGIKVLKAAIKVACPVNKKVKIAYLKYYFKTWEGSYMFLMPAFPIGCILYYLKRKHIGQPTVYFPFFIVVPTAIFYIVVFGLGFSMDELREIGWLFPEVDYNNFWNQWTEMYGGIQDDRVEWSAMSAAIPSWCIMLIIVALDNMLKLASTESSLSIDFDYNAEMKVGGCATILTAILGGSPAYSQTKFNVLNYAMTHSTTKRAGTIVCALLNGALFFSGFPLINYLPRFVLSALLVFSSVGFLIENLWDARLKFNKTNFFTIWAIFITNIIAGELAPSHALLIAIIAGLLLGLVAFAVHFARKSGSMSSSKQVMVSGEESSSTAIRSSSQEAKLGILGVWYSIMHPSGYIFFGTAARLHRIIKVHIEEMNERARAERTKKIILDFTDVYGIDVSASLIFTKIARLCKSNGIELKWTGMRPSILNNLTRAGVIKVGAPGIYDDLDTAQKHVEDELLAHVHKLSSKWLVDKRCRNIYNRAMLHDALNNNCPMSGEGIAPTQLLRWSARSFVSKGENILIEGQDDDGLYLLYKGEVRADHCSAEIEAHTIYPGAYFNEHVIYSPPETGALYTAHAEDDCVILRLSHEQRQTMLHSSPFHMYQLMIAVFKQVEMRNPQRRRHTWMSKLEGAQSHVVSFSAKPELSLDDEEPEAEETDALLEEGPAKDDHHGWGSVKKSLMGASAAIAIAKAGARRGSCVGTVVVPKAGLPDVTATSATSQALEEGNEGAPQKPVAVPPNAKRRGSCVGSMVAGALATAALTESAEPAKLENKGSRRRGSCVGQMAAAAAHEKDAAIKKMLHSAISAEDDVEAANKAGSDKHASASSPSKRRGSMMGWWAHDAHHDDHHGHGHGTTGRRRSSVTGAAHAVANFLKGHHDEHHDGHPAASPDAAHGGAVQRRGSVTGGGHRRKSITGQIADIVKLHHPEYHHTQHIQHSNINDDHHEALTKDRKAVDHDHYIRHTEVVDAQFLREADFRVPLTPHQVEHYTLIFDLNHDPATETSDHKHDRLKMSDLSHFMESLGFPVPEEDLNQMVNDMHIPSKEASIELNGFIEFMRRTLVADLPSAKIPTIHFLFSAEAAKNEAKALAVTTAAERRKARSSKEHMDTVKSRAIRPSKEDMEEVDQRREPRASAEAIANVPKTVKKAQAAEMLAKLGFVLDELTINEAFAEVDGDGDGMITEGEFITCLGILKRNLLEVHQLEKSFTQFRTLSKKAAADKRAAEEAKEGEEKGGRHMSLGSLPAFAGKKKRGSSASVEEMDVEDEVPDGDHVLYASDLVAALGVSPDEAEEMIFVADLKENQSIDFTEFKQVVVNWSG